MAEKIGVKRDSNHPTTVFFEGGLSRQAIIVKAFEEVKKYYLDVQEQWIQSDLWVDLIKERIHGITNDVKQPQQSQ